MNRALALTLALMLVLAPVVPFAAVGTAAAAPPGFVTTGSEVVEQEVAVGQPPQKALTASKQKRGSGQGQGQGPPMHALEKMPSHARENVLASRGSIQTQWAPTANGEPALVLTDEERSGSGEVAIPVEAFKSSMGQLPEAAYGVHESGEQWQTEVVVEDGYAIIEIPHFSTNTVSFTGEISIQANNAANATQFAYDAPTSGTIADETLKLTGTLGTQQETITQTTTSGSIPLDVGGGVPATNAQLSITGNHRQIQRSQFGSVISGSTTTQSLSPAGDDPISGGEIQIDASTQSMTDYVGIDTRPGWGRSDPDNNWDFDTQGYDIKEVTVEYDILDSKSTGAEDFQFYVQGSQQASWSHETGGSWETHTKSFSYNYDGGGIIDMSVAPSFTDTSDSQLTIQEIQITTDAPSTVSVTPSDGSESTYSVSDGYSGTKSIPISKSTSSVDLSVDQGGFDYDVRYTEGHDTEDPSVSVAGTSYSHTGVLADGGTKTWGLPDIDPGTGPADVSVEGAGQVDFNMSFTERTPTQDPAVTIESGGGTQTIEHTGTLQNGSTVDLSDQLNTSLLGNATTLTVNVNDPATGPNGRVGVAYSHSAQDKIVTSYQASTFEESYNISHTYAGATENAQATIPFASSRVLGVENVEYRVDGGSWISVAPANYRFEDTTLDVYLDDATGGVAAGQTVDVRATGRKISVENGAVTVQDPTAPGEELDTQLQVDSRSPGFAVNVGPTDDGDRVHYAYSDSFPTEDYVVIDSSGDQQLFLPNSVTGDQFRVSHLDTRVVAEQGDVRIDVVKPGENPELDVSPGPGGSGDPVTVEYYNTESGVTYLLNSLTRNIVVDSDTAESPAIFEDDDSEDTWSILRDSGPTGSTSDGGAIGQFRETASGAVGSISLPIDGSGLGQLALASALGVVGVVALRRLWPFGDSDDSAAVTSSTGTASGSSDASKLARRAGVGFTAFAKSFGSVSSQAARTTGSGLLVGLRRLLAYIGSVTAIILGNRRASVAAAVVSTIIAARVGLFQLPEGTGILIVVSGVPLATWLIMRRSDAISQRVWIASTVAAVILGLEFVAPGTVQTAIEQLTSEQVAPLLILVGAGAIYLWYRARQSDRPQIIIGGNNE